MKWWSDLWLKESFATYLSHLCMENAEGLEEYKESWGLFLNYKTWAYREDQLPSTHPIATNCQNTEEAENNFDGITYAKGSSVLKQLTYYIGMERFKEGIQSYINKFAWKNTNLDDFMNCLQTSCTKHVETKTIDLQHWVNTWLRTKGMNEIEPIAEYENGKVKSFQIKQKFAPFADEKYRMQRIDIALYDKEFNETCVKNVFIEDQEITEVGEMIGKDQPFAFYINANDNGFGKFQIDRDTFLNLKANLHKVKDDVNRKMIWRAIWDLVQDIKISAYEYLEFLYFTLEDEPDSDTISTNLFYAKYAIEKYVPWEMKSREHEKMFIFLYNQLNSEKPPSIRNAFLNKMPEFAESKGQKNLVLQWLEHGLCSYEKKPIPNLSVSQGLHYEIVKNMHADDSIPMETKEELISKVLEKDKSNTAIDLKRSCESALPLPEIKERLWNWYTDLEAKDSDKVFTASMQSFNHWSQEIILEPYVDKFFQVIMQVFTHRDRSFAKIFFLYLKPVFYNQEVKKNLQNAHFF
jgi:aminopeptidase N